MTSGNQVSHFTIIPIYSFRNWRFENENNQTIMINVITSFPILNRHKSSKSKDFRLFFSKIFNSITEQQQTLSFLIFIFRQYEQNRLVTQTYRNHFSKRSVSGKKSRRQIYRPTRRHVANGKTMEARKQTITARNHLSLLQPPNFSALFVAISFHMQKLKKKTLKCNELVIKCPRDKNRSFAVRKT